MRFPKTLSFLIVATALPFAPAPWARQRNVAPTLRSAPTGHLPGTHSVAAVSDRRSAVGTPPLQKANLKVSATTAGASPGNAANPSKPFT
jgi:hypothetical protein